MSFARDGGDHLRCSWTSFAEPGLCFVWRFCPYFSGAAIRLGKDVIYMIIKVLEMLWRWTW